MAYRNIEELMKNKVFYHFLEISKIPRQTFFEKEVSDYILNWAKNLGLEAYQDKYHNLLIRKNASSGYENKKPIIIQAHIDMVCEKKPEVKHDFRKDPIKVQLDGDILSTGNKTTLGGDDGIGVAMAMAILEDKNLKHPPIDVILTSAEEEDMSGALNIDKSWFHTNRMINIDHIVDNELIAGSCGGKGVELKFPLEYIKRNANYKGYKIKIDGLIGGHSGEDINRGRANANILLARLLASFKGKFDFLVSELKGGNFRLAIPREAIIVLALEEKNYSLLKEAVEKFEKEIRKVFETAEKNINISLEETELKEELIAKSSVEKIIKTIILSPNGIEDMLGDLNVVESSCNLGEIYIENGDVYFVSEIRATFEINREYIYEKILLVAEQVNGEVREFSAYPSWTYKSDSNLRTQAEEVYKELFGEDIKTLVLHAGLECGCFAPKICDMDAISIGPNAWDLHSPKERLSVSSTEKVYKYLLKILEKLD